jgi:hypothetical protein
MDNSEIITTFGHKGHKKKTKTTNKQTNNHRKLKI